MRAEQLPAGYRFTPEGDGVDGREILVETVDVEDGQVHINGKYANDPDVNVGVTVPIGTDL